MPAWPATLPQYLLTDGYAQGIGDGRIRSPTDTGPGKVRRRSTAMVEPIVGRMRMTGAQIAILRTFISTDLGDGVTSFTFPDPVTRATINVRFGEDLPSWSHVGAEIFDVSLSLEKLPG